MIMNIKTTQLEIPSGQSCMSTTPTPPPLPAIRAQGHTDGPFYLLVIVVSFINDLPTK